jgi:hypothetical protein
LQKDPAYKYNKKVKGPWIGALIVSFMAYYLFGFTTSSIAMLSLLAPLMYYKPLVSINHNSIIYRSSNVVEYSAKTVFDYLKKYYREEIKFCGGRIIKD